MAFSARMTPSPPRTDSRRDLLPGFLLVAVGIGFTFVPISIAALAGIEAPEAGLA